jgi:hypothetical protein
MVRLRETTIVVLASMMLAVVSCSGRIDTSGGGASSSPPYLSDAGAADSTTGTTDTSAPRTEDSGVMTTWCDSYAPPPVGVGDAGLTCSDPIHVSIGQTLTGFTCGGARLPSYGCGDECPHPAVYFVVDAPNGAPFHIALVGAPTGSPGGEQLSVYDYDRCGGNWLGCTSGQTYPGSPSAVFAVVRFDVPCGDFTIAVVAGG